MYLEQNLDNEQQNHLKSHGYELKLKYRYLLPLFLNDFETTHNFFRNWF